MACTRVSSAQGAKRLAATTSDASLPLDGSVLSMVADLEGHDLNGLRRHWRAHLGGEPPTHLPRWLLMRVLLASIREARILRTRILTFGASLSQTCLTTVHLVFKFDHALLPYGQSRHGRMQPLISAGGQCG